MPLLIESQFCPPIESLHFIKEYGSVCWDISSFYEKKSYRNRCHLVSSHGLLRLSIPLKKDKIQKQLLEQVCIAYDSKWQINHWRSIESAYNRSPFFEFYKDELNALFFKEYKYLIDFNKALFDWIIEKMQLDVTQNFTTHYISGEGFYDMRERIKPKNKSFVNKPYVQVFEDRLCFMSNLSSLDLLFNCGPNSKDYL